MLREKAILNAKPKEKPYKLADGGGLYLLVRPDGKKYWRLKYRFGGKEKLLALGVYPEVTAATARDGRDEAKRQLKDGRDPSTVRQDEKLLAKVAAENTFEIVAREWIKNQTAEPGSEGWSQAHADRALDSLIKFVFPYLGTKPISEITAPQLLAVLRKLEARGIYETAQRVLQRSTQIFAYAISTGRAERNPGADLKGVLKTPKVKHRPAIQEDELPEFVRKMRDYHGSRVTKLALELSALTFVRPGELRGTEWTELPAGVTEWRIPAERMKMKQPHVVPLSKQAIACIEELRTLTGAGKYVFPCERNARKCMSENTVTQAIYRMGYHSRATAHGFRTTASTILNGQGWNPDAIERQLAHKEPNKVRDAYNRAEYLPERRKMMQAWADYLDGIAAGANVTPIRREAA